MIQPYLAIKARRLPDSGVDFSTIITP